MCWGSQGSWYAERWWLFGNRGSMECHLNTCPFIRQESKVCRLYGLEAPSDAAGRGSNSLLVESLEIARLLADHDRAAFRAQGTCMFPGVQPGDLLHIESRRIEEVMVGDIAVIRRDGLFFGHRTIATGRDDAGAYIVTRPDRSNQGSDPPAYAKDLLGIVSRIQRRGRDVSREPKVLGAYAKSKVLLWEWWNWRVRSRLTGNVERLQTMPVYRLIASWYCNVRHQHVRYEVKMPLKPMQSHDLYRVFLPDAFDVSKPLQKGAPVMQWTLTLSLQGMKRPVAWVTLIRRPDACCQGEGWYIVRSWVQIRYRGAGFERRLVRTAEKILARSGAELHKDTKLGLPLSFRDGIEKSREHNN